MKILSLKKPLRVVYKLPQLGLLPGLLLLLWLAGRNLILRNDPTAGLGDQDAWLYMLQSMIAFMMVVPLSWWFLQRFWMALGLPSINGLIVHFKELEPWQKLVCCFSSYALLLLAAVGCLIAIC